MHQVLAPLLVKVWRMYALTNASGRFRRTKISHLQAALLTLPHIGTEVIILAVSSIFDDFTPISQVEIAEGLATQVLSCKENHSIAI